MLGMRLADRCTLAQWESAGRFPNFTKLLDIGKLQSRFHHIRRLKMSKLFTWEYKVFAALRVEYTNCSINNTALVIPEGLLIAQSVQIIDEEKQGHKYEQEYTLTWGNAGCRISFIVKRPSSFLSVFQLQRRQKHNVKNPPGQAQLSLTTLNQRKIPHFAKHNKQQSTNWPPFPRDQPAPALQVMQILQIRCTQCSPTGGAAFSA